MRSSFVAMAVSGLLLLGSAPVRATTITFDDAPAPCLAVDTSPLTEAYAGLGVHFQGPSVGQGGAIFNVCSGFGIGARSGENFLGFAIGTYALDPETITFDSEVSYVEIYAGYRSSQTYNMFAFDALNNLIGSSTVTPAGGVYGQLAIAAAG